MKLDEAGSFAVGTAIGLGDRIVDGIVATGAPGRLIGARTGAVDGTDDMDGTSVTGVSEGTIATTTGALIGAMAGAGVEIIVDGTVVTGGSEGTIVTITGALIGAMVGGGVGTVFQTILPGFLGVPW